MFQRKLQALKCPLITDLDPNDEAKFRAMVVWLEDEKIRHYPSQERDFLRNVQSQEWDKGLDKYVADLDLDLGLELTRTRFQVVDALLSLAVQLEYQDKKDEFNSRASQVKDTGPKIVAKNPLDNLQFNSPEFIKGVNDLADMLKVTKHEEHLVTLEACARLIKTRYSKEGIESGENVTKKGVPFPFQEVDKSFNSGDPSLDQAAKIMRLLFIMDLRDLQTKINECIVAVQNVTANPKTDTKLGKVGY